MQDKNCEFVFTARMHWLLKKILRLLWCVTVNDETKVLQRSPRLIVANCDSALDGVLLGLFLPGRPLIVAVPEMMTHPIARRLMRFVRNVSLDPTHPLVIKDLVHRLKAGESVVIFPQGRVTTTGGIMKVYDAAGIIAGHCDADLVPVRVHGTLYSRFACVAGNWPKKRFPAMSLTVHAPLRLPAVRGSGRQRRQRLSAEMLHILQTMMSIPVRRRDLFGAFLDALALHGRGNRIMEDARRQPESYGQLLKVALILGRVVARSTANRENVGLLLPSISTTAALLLGLVAHNRVAAMLNYSAGPEAVRSACATARVRTVVTSRQFLQVLKLQSIVGVLEGIQIIYLEDLRAGLSLADKLWLVTYAMWFPRAATSTVDPVSTAVVLFTSGSEGKPKGIEINHDALLANMEQLQSVIDFGPNDKYFSALPLYHTFGLVACTLMPLITGTRLFLYVSPLRYRTIPEIAYQCDCTYIFGTSTFLGHYGRNAHAFDFRSVQKVICGGEKLNREVEELWREKFGLRILEGYGATECGPAMALNTPLAYRRGSVGRLLPRVEYRLLPIPGIAMGGALHVRSPNLMRGYLLPDNPGTLVVPRSECGEGWYDTGDVVEIDDDGYVTIVGRTRRFAKIAGEMVALDLVEKIAARASPQHQHAVTLAQLPGSGESTVLFTTDASLDRAALSRAARELGAQELAIARRIVRVDQLPLLGNGKTDYVALRMRADTAPQGEQ